jgi:hypothetical protein
MHGQFLLKNSNSLVNVFQMHNFDTPKNSFLYLRVWEHIIVEMQELVKEINHSRTYHKLHKLIAIHSNCNSKSLLSRIRER